MIILRFPDLLKFLEKEYGIEVSQKRFAEIAGIAPDRLSRIMPAKKEGLSFQAKPAEEKPIPKSLIENVSKSSKKYGKGKKKENVTTQFLNQILEGSWRLILKSGKKIKDVDKEDLFSKLVRNLVDYIPDEGRDSPTDLLYQRRVKLNGKMDKFLEHYRELNSQKNIYNGDNREAFRKWLLTEYNLKVSPQ